MCTKHLDAEINIPMLLAFLATFVAMWRQRKLDKRATAALGIMLLTAIAMTYFSVSHGFNKVGFIARSIQFFYRMVTYVNLSLFVGILFAGVRTYLTRFTGTAQSTLDDNAEIPVTGRGGEEERGGGGNGETAKPARLSSPVFANRTALYAALAVSALALALKLGYTSYFPPFPGHVFASQRSDHELLQLPKEFYGTVDYTMPGMVADVPEKDKSEAVWLIPAQGKQFGMIQPLPIPTHDGWSLTNVQEFVWNKLTLNGTPLAKDQVAAKDNYYAVSDHAGQELGYECTPDPIWELGNRTSVPLFLLWLLGTVVVCIKSRKKPIAHEQQQRDFQTISGGASA